MKFAGKWMLSNSRQGVATHLDCWSFYGILPIGLHFTPFITSKISLVGDQESPTHCRPEVQHRKMLSHHGRHGGASPPKTLRNMVLFFLNWVFRKQLLRVVLLEVWLLCTVSWCRTAFASTLLDRSSSTGDAWWSSRILLRRFLFSRALDSTWFILVLQFYMSGSSCPLQEAGAGDRKVSSRLHPCRGQSLRLAHGLAWAVWFGRSWGGLYNSTQPLCHQYI